MSHPTYAAARDLLTRALVRLHGCRADTVAGENDRLGLVRQIQAHLDSVTAAGDPTPEWWVVLDEVSDRYLVRNPSVLSPVAPDAWLLDGSPASAAYYETAPEARTARQAAAEAFKPLPPATRPRLVVYKV